MAIFDYKGLNQKGKKVSGIIDAESTNAAKFKLRQKDIFPTSLKSIESDHKEKGKSISFFNSITLFSKAKSSELSMITRQLSTLLSSGFPLVPAIEILITQTKSHFMKKVLSKIKNSLEEGTSFANALSLYPHVFSPVFINMVNAGESSGTLDIILERLADFAENREDSKKKLQSLLAYPLLMAFIGFGILAFLLTYVVPGVVNIFLDMNHPLPMPTVVLLWLSSFFKENWWIIVFMPFLFYITVHLIRKIETGGYFFDKLILSVPIIGKLVQKNITARISRTLGSLLGAGVPLLKALNITKGITGNCVMSELMSKAYDSVEKGGDLGEFLVRSSDFPYFAAQMIKIGENSGKMEKMLEKTSEIFEKEVQTTLAMAMSLIEPLIILAMGIIVGCIIIAICLPIFEINQLIQ